MDHIFLSLGILSVLNLNNFIFQNQNQKYQLTVKLSVDDLMILTWGVGGRRSWSWSPSISSLSLEDFGDSESGSLSSRAFLSLGETNLWSGETSLGVLWHFVLFSFTLSRMFPLLGVLLPRRTSCLMLALLRARDLRLEIIFIQTRKNAIHSYVCGNPVDGYFSILTWKYNEENFQSTFYPLPTQLSASKYHVKSSGKLCNFCSYLFSIPAIVAFSMLEIWPLTTTLSLRGSGLFNSKHPQHTD